MDHCPVPGRHRTQRQVRTLKVAAAVLALTVVATASWAGVRLLSGPRCAGEVRLSVVAAPEIAPAIRSTAADWTETATVDGKCVAVQVTGQESADVAAGVAAQQGQRLLGLGEAKGSAQVPQVWVPDSSMWRLRLQAAAAGFRPTDTTSIAVSPVVLAVPQPVAGNFGPAGAELTWDSLLRQTQAGNKITAGVVDPTRDTAGLSGLLSFGQAAAKLGPKAQPATVATLRALAKGGSAVRDDLLSRFPRSLDAAAIASSLTAAVLPEQAVIQYNAAAAPIPLAARYVTPAPPSLDYPFLVMPGAAPAVSQAAAGLRTALGSPGFRDALARQGLRGADGAGGAGFAYPAGAPTPSATARGSGGTSGGVDLSAVDRTLEAWLALTHPGRILAVIDVSGSMLTKVPTAGNRTREQVTVEAATRGLDLFDDSWALGLWTFSTNLDGPRDHRELLPVGPLVASRDRAVQQLAAIKPKKNGDTGLYDTILAAYQEMQDGWDPGRLNTVVIMTDGDNDDDNGVSLPALLARLGQLKDPTRPVDIVAIGIGPDVTQGPLQQITGTTGGGVFTAPDPADIAAIFLKALALHTQSK
ncbi:VWA domain-containing protein [Actinoplanes sp. ATCC 53533]|nr:VWA domain-containing protein [Actinoplanes sp. ATCC 53533]